MLVELWRDGRVLKGEFRSGEVSLRPSLVGFEDAARRVVKAMRRGDTVHCSFEGFPNLPLHAAPVLDRVVAEARRLACSLAMVGLPADLGLRYDEYVPGPVRVREAWRRRSTSSRRRRVGRRA